MATAAKCIDDLSDKSLVIKNTVMLNSKGLNLLM